MDLVAMEFEGKKIKFEQRENGLYLNINSIANRTTIDNWRRSANTSRYIKGLQSYANFTEEELITTLAGSHSGTWIHEKLILNFARYVSIDFELWCDDVIRKVLEDGYYVSKDINEKQIDKLKQTLNSMELELLRTKNSLQTMYRQKEEYRLRMEMTKEYKADYYSFERELRDRNETIKKQNVMLAQARLKIKEMEGE
jgi:hypothetical protein